jgi:hypothetical protein
MPHLEYRENVEGTMTFGKCVCGTGVRNMRTRRSREPAEPTMPSLEAPAVLSVTAISRAGVKSSSSDAAVARADVPRDLAAE